MSEFIRFRYANGEHFQRLVSLFEAIKNVKNSHNPSSHYNLMALREMLPLGICDNFSWPTSEDPYFDPSRPIAISPPGSYQGERWRFDAILELIEMGDYELLECRTMDQDYAEMHIRAYGYPYGGLNAFIALAEGFGFTVVGSNESGVYEALNN